MNKKEKYPVELFYRGKQEIIILNNEKDQQIVVDLILTLQNLCSSNLQSQLEMANKKLNKIKELVNKYGYYTLSEIPEILSIIDGSDE